MTDDERDAVMSTAIRHWKTNFAGISSLDVSREIGVPHDSVLEAFDELEQAGLATLNRDETLVLVRLLSTPGLPREEPEQVVCSILFPSQRVLPEVYDRERVDRGPYLNRLHHGERQVVMCYFNIEVLSKYRDQQEKYHFQDDDMAGWVATKDAYYFTLPEHARDDETVGSINYGKPRLAGGDVAVAAILKDLAALPHKEQLYWRSFELDQPILAPDDPTFEKFVRQEFDAEDVDREDPIQMIYGGVERINSLFAPEDLFLVTIPNPYLQYPVLNTNRAYNDAHKELCKALGLDHSKKLNGPLLERVLAKLGQPESANKGEDAWSKFKRVVAALPLKDHDAVVAPLKNCRDARNVNSHDTERPILPAVDLRERFRSDCATIAASLAQIEAALSRT